MRKIRYSAVAAAGLLALALAFPAYGKDKEEREPVGQISLRISSDIEAGEDGDGIVLLGSSRLRPLVWNILKI